MDNDILDLIAEIQLKLSPKEKRKFTKVFKGNKELVRKELAKKIEKDGKLD